MKKLTQGKLTPLVRAGLSYSLIILFSMIISIENVSATYSVHASSGTTCSCGCQDEGGDCGGDCCSSMSVSQCNCNEPHKKVVIFVMPGTLDLFVQSNQFLNKLYIPKAGLLRSECVYYESCVIEPPTPVPIT